MLAGIFFADRQPAAWIALASKRRTADPAKIGGAVMDGIAIKY
jgi:hypothetical protein